MAEEPDAFDAELTQQTILLMLMRIYDVNMSILSEMNDERAAHIEKIHDNGGILTEFPWLRQGEEK